MTPLFQKLNLGSIRDILVIDAPESFEAELAGLEGVKVHRSAQGQKSAPFVLGFVKTLAEVEAMAQVVSTTEGDAVIWLAYPKGTSKRYRCEFNRDNGWAAMGTLGFEGVRMVAIDDDWSALRFRRVEFIKSMTRDASRATSAVGKERTSQSDRPRGRKRS